MDELVAQLDSLADPANAEVLTRYLQVRPGGYGDGDQLLGVTVGQLRALAKPYVRIEIHAEEWLPLLRSPIHEHRMITLIIMAERARRGEADELADIYRTYRANTDRINNWDLVDVSCAAIVGRYLMDRSRDELDQLAGSTLLWERRISIISTHHFIRAGQTADAYRLAETLMGDTHDLMHKAVGWTLREAGKRVDRDGLRRFLDRHAARMPRTALRYAIEHFDAEERQHYRSLR